MSCLVLAVPAGSAMAGLDIYDSRKPPALVEQPESLVYPLDDFESQAVEDKLALLQKAISKTKGEQANLLHLAAGYLELISGSASEACDRLKSKIGRNFILEDYRIHFISQCELRLAKDSLTKEQPEAARKRARKVIERNLELFEVFPESPFQDNIQIQIAESEFVMGEAFLREKNYRGAWQYYRRALMRIEDNTELWKRAIENLAQVYEGAGEVFYALDLLVYLHRNQGTAETRATLADFLRRNEKQLGEEYEKSLRLVEPQIKSQSELSAVGTPREPGRPQTSPFLERFDKAMQGQDLKELVQASVDLLQAMPGNVATRNVLPDLRRYLWRFLQTNEWASALDELLKQFPDSSLEKLAYGLWVRGEYQDASRVYELLFSRNPPDRELGHKVLFFLGRIQEDVGNFKKAAEHYKKLLSAYDDGPYTERTRFKLGWVLYRDGNQEESARIFRANLKITGSESKKGDENWVSSQYWLGKILHEKGQQDQAVALWSELIDEVPLEFYSLLARASTGKQISDLFSGDDIKLTRRVTGIGEREKKHLARAELLGAVGLWSFAREELKQVSSASGDPGWLLYYLTLSQQVRRYSNSIGIAWRLGMKNDFHSLPSNLARILFPAGFLEQVKAAAAPTRLDPYLVLALIRQESAFDHEALSTARAHGLMQLLPSTARQVAKNNGIGLEDKEELHRPGKNIELGVAYLDKLVRRYDGNLVMALAAYNAGPGNVSRWAESREELSPLEFLESIPYNETRGYVKKVLRNFWLYHTLYSSGPLPWIDPLMKGIQEDSQPPESP